MAGEVVGDVLPLAVRPADRAFHHPRAVLAGPSAVGVDVVDPHPDPVRHGARRRWLTLAAHVGHDHRAAAGVQLGAVILADAQAFAEAERGLKPGDGRAHVGIDEDRDDGRGGVKKQLRGMRRV